MIGVTQATLMTGATETCATCMKMLRPQLHRVLEGVQNAVEAEEARLEGKEVLWWTIYLRHPRHPVYKTHHVYKTPAPIYIYIYI